MKNFGRYYRELTRRGGKSVPNADEAMRDYQDALLRTMDAMLYAC